jgi:hypothetical protein
MTSKVNTAFDLAAPALEISIFLAGCELHFQLPCCERQRMKRFAF